MTHLMIAAQALIFTPVFKAIPFRDGFSICP